MSPSLYHESLPIARVIVHTMNPEIKITEIQTNKKFYTNYREFFLAEMQLSDVPKYELQKYTNTNYRNTEIQITEIYKY